MKSWLYMSVRAFWLIGVVLMIPQGAPGLAQETVSAGCDATSNSAGMDHETMASPSASMPMPEMHHGTPMAGMHDVEFDLMYIDMMIPHHESVIALAEVAQHELTHPELIEIARAIVETQDAEIDEMELLREEWYPNADSVSMDAMIGMPGMGTDVAMMDQQMSAEWQVQTFCAADNKDLAFIDQVIPHHQMAIDVSEAALDHAVHPELEAIAQRVIEDQQHEIDELQTIRLELTREASPES